MTLRRAAYTLGSAVPAAVAGGGVPWWQRVLLAALTAIITALAGELARKEP